MNLKLYIQFHKKPGSDLLKQIYFDCMDNFMFSKLGFDA